MFEHISENYEERGKVCYSHILYWKIDLKLNELWAMWISDHPSRFILRVTDNKKLELPTGKFKSFYSFLTVSHLEWIRGAYDIKLWKGKV